MHLTHRTLRIQSWLISGKNKGRIAQKSELQQKKMLAQQALKPENSMQQESSGRETTKIEVKQGEKA